MPSADRLRRRHLLLAGFMGSGKSTAGPLLATQLRLPYRELDERVQERYQLSIPEIFAFLGEEAFRRSESWELSRLLLDPPAVIALGGGAFHSRNQLLIPPHCPTIWLDVSLKLAWQRCRQDPNRPLAADLTAFRELYLARQADYRQALYHVRVEGKSPPAVAREIEGLI